MTTRRKFGLGGIAAIIAAQRAPAALVRSLVSGRHIAALKKDVPATRHNQITADGGTISAAEVTL